MCHQAKVLVLKCICSQVVTKMLQYCPPRPQVMERRWKSNAELAPNCPRCASSNTKFCYYNNYSLSQPRYFCKGCRRYWTKGGSLRNIPVGGGCRKNRRGKSVRLVQNERVSMNYSRDMASSRPPPSQHSCLSNEDFSILPHGRANGSDIDLALVFAEYLNQNSSLDTEFVGQELPSEANVSPDLPSNVSSIQQENIMMIECEKPCNAIGEGQLLEGLPQVYEGDNQQEEKAQEFMAHDPGAFELQTLLNDEMVHDSLWLDASTMTNYTWEPVVQLQEFESLSSIDQLKISTNLISDNWSSYDLSSYELSSRP